MPNTIYVDKTTVVTTPSVQDFNDTVYGALAAAKTPATARTALELDGFVSPTTTPITGGVFRKNAIINSSMDINQRGGAFVAVPTATYTLDRWQYTKAGITVHTVTQDSDVPTVAQAGVLFTNSLRLNLTTADTTLAAGDICLVAQYVEGYNWRPLAQRPCVLSFWVKATLPGVYSVSFKNLSSDRSFVQNFTINAASTWEYKSITVPASPSAGGWNYTNSIGLQVSFVLATGSTFHTTPGVWQTGNFLGTSSNINGVNTGATDFRFTGVQLEAGTVATELENREFAEELSLCQRYFWKSFTQLVTPVQNGGSAGALAYRAFFAGFTNGGVLVRYPTPMRIAPTVVFFNPSAANANWRNFSLGADSGAAIVEVPGDAGGLYTSIQVAGDLVGHLLGIHATASAEL